MSGADPFEHPVVRDKRRVHFDPESGAVSQEPTGGGPAAAGPPDPFGIGADSIELSQLRTELAERTADLQRLQAEYANYRKRVERDREAVRDFAVGEALAALLPVLDDIGRAREHGELEGGFRQVAEALDAALAKLGLTRFGQPGEPFDPTQHDALMHSYSDEVTEPTAVQILQPGYSYGGRVIRPARVAVAEPTTALPDDDPETAAIPEPVEDATAADDAGTSASG
ncbi:MAG: molecular chaperone GrpE [Actinomycetota bacterium]|nr:molecular chaperone GrpE [Actinomycetota bacterium]MDQ1542105.1 molecular chaperone GrpE [Actinomycetota bacterium]